MKRRGASAARRAWSKRRRATNKSAGRCINDTINPSHEAPLRGVRCTKCVETHKRSRT